MTNGGQVNKESLGMLKENLEGFKAIKRAFEKDPKEGMRYYGGEIDLCKICPEFKVVVEENGVKSLDCKTCPVVISSGETCVEWFRKWGMKKGCLNEKEGLFWTGKIVDEYEAFLRRCEP